MGRHPSETGAIISQSMALSVDVEKNPSCKYGMQHALHSNVVPRQLTVIPQKGRGWVVNKTHRASKMDSSTYEEMKSASLAQVPGTRI
jgi:hypothetical protein